MVSCKKVIRSSRSAQDTFDFMSDFRNAPQWDPGTKAAELIKPSLENLEVGLGSQFSLMLDFKVRQVPVIYEITEFEAPNKVVLEVAHDWFRGTDVVTVENVGETILMTYYAEITMKKVPTLTSPIMNVLFPTICNRAEQLLNRVLG